MAKLTESELKALERLKKFAAEVEAIPADQKKPLGNPGKWAYPATIDEHGKVIPESTDATGT